MRAVLLVAAVALVLVSCAPTAKAVETALEMASNCKPVAEARLTEQKIYFETNFETGRCWGFFKAFHQAVRIGDSGAKRGYLGLCLPSDAAVQLRRLAAWLEGGNETPARLLASALGAVERP